VNWPHLRSGLVTKLESALHPEVIRRSSPRAKSLGKVVTHPIFMLDGKSLRKHDINHDERWGLKHARWIVPLALGLEVGQYSLGVAQGWH
jgi:hypothetical protein